MIWLISMARPGGKVRDEMYIVEEDKVEEAPCRQQGGIRGARHRASFDHSN
jgi:hypothetical protein